MASKIVNRPITLVVTMCVLLVGSIAMAMLLVHLKSGLWRIALTEPQTVGSVEVRLPVGWDLDYSTRGSTETIELTETAPPRRSLSIQVADLDARVSAMDFLLSSDLVMMLDRGVINAAEEVTVDGGNGYIIHPIQGPSLAIITFRDGRAAMVQLESGSTSSGNDDAIVYHVTKSLRLVGPAPEQEPEPEQPRRWIPRRRGREI